MENGKRNKLADADISQPSALNSGAKLPARKPRNPLAGQKASEAARFKANSAQPAIDPKTVAAKRQGVTSAASVSAHPAASDRSSASLSPAATPQPPAPLASQRIEGAAAAPAAASASDHACSGAPSPTPPVAPGRTHGPAPDPAANNLRRYMAAPAPRRTRSASLANPNGRLSAFVLKLVAIVAMTANHSAYIFYHYLPPEVLGVFFTVGGLTFPIMAFLLVEGYNHTSNLQKYATRLLVFALVSEIPFWLFLEPKGNVLFTLLIGLIVLKLYDDWGAASPKFWVAVVAAVYVSSYCDWGMIGPIVILMMRALSDRRMRIVYPIVLIMAAVGLPNLMYAISAASTIALPFALYAFVGSGADIPLLLSYDGRRGRPLKWFFYAYYPAHILVLGLLKGLVFNDWTIAL